MGKPRRVSGILESPLELLCSVFLILILTLVFSEVISRYVFSASHGFMEEFSRWFQVWIAYLILGVVEKRRQHIAIDILPGILSGKCKSAVMIVVSVMNLIVAIFLCWAGIKMTHLLRETSVLSQTDIPTPMWIVRICVPLGAFFLGLFSLENLIADIRSLRNYSKEKD
jgi:TRAP-type C4-dicarboxylate transport system permease small subunit